MGREATCQLRWGNESASCKVLLEARELIVRGEIRHRLPISVLRDVSAEGDQLTFRVGLESVALRLGSELAGTWAKAMAAPPPSLATKLGITGDSKVLLLGEPEGAELEAAIGIANPVNGEQPDLMVALASTTAALDSALHQLDGTPIWIIYPKGRGRELDEASIRAALRAQGYVDTKVVSVSATLTGLRFQKRAVAKISAPVARVDERRLRDLAGIGPSLEADLKSLGVRTVEELAERDGSDLYNALCAQTGTRQDPCVLDTFRCAVAQARDGNLDTAQRNWWWWSRERKAGRI